MCVIKNDPGEYNLGYQRKLSEASHIRLTQENPYMELMLASRRCKLAIFMTWTHFAGNPSFSHDDVIKWKHFPRYWPLARGIHRSPVNSPHKGQWSGDLMFSLICAWINGWVNNDEVCDLRRHGAHYDVIVMWLQDTNQREITLVYNEWFYYRAGHYFKNKFRWQNLHWLYL